MAKQNFYRCGQAGKEVGISSYKIRRLAETGLIPDAEFNGAQWHIPVSAIERLKREGVPALPKVVDVDDEADAPAASQKDRPTSTLLAPPSEEMIAAAEEAEMSVHQLKAAQNNLERNKIRKEQTEIADYFTDREKRLQEREAEELQRYEEELEADASRQRKEASAVKRQAFFSKWLEYGTARKPWGAPDEVRLDIHAAVLDALMKMDTNERDIVVQRLVDGAVERGLKTWKSAEAKREAIEHAISGLPWRMKNDKGWKVQSGKAAREALMEAGGSEEEMETLAQAVLQPLIQQFEHAERIEEAINGVHVDYATQDELSDAHDSVREALKALPISSTSRQVNTVRDQALIPVKARVAERIASQEAARRREESKRRRESVLWSISRSLPCGLSDEDKKAAVAELAEALDEQSPNASESDMEEVRDRIVEDYQREHEAEAKRAERKAKRTRAKAELVRYGLSQVWTYAQKMLQEFDYDRSETALGINSRVKDEVRKVLEDELDGRETEEEVARLVRRTMRQAEGCH
jgi:hypothetical protein